MDNENRSAVCALCKKRVALKLSHIIPRSLMQGLPDENGRTFAFNLQEAEAPKYNTRLTEKLLCAECESKIAKHEKYFVEELIRGKCSSTQLTENVYRLSGLDYLHFKLFYLSVLWRAHISSLDFFQKIDLGAKHGSQIASMLIANNPGEESDYPIIFSYLRLADKPSLGIDSITQPTKTRLCGARAYRFLFGGVDYCVAVTQRPTGFYKLHTICKDGTINSLAVHENEHDLLSYAKPKILAGLLKKSLDK